MRKTEIYSRTVMWFCTLLLTALISGCGGGGQSPILGSNVSPNAPPPGANAPYAPPPGAIAPGEVCSAGASSTIPTVTSSNPSNSDTGVPTSTSGVSGGDAIITANFDMAMNGTTINSSSFTLTPNGGSALANTVVNYNSSTNVASLTTSGALLPGTLYHATILNSVTSASGTPMSCSYAWSFTTITPAASGPAPINLGSAAVFGAFGGSAGLTNQGIYTVINNGSIGTTGASTLVTGFNDNGTGCIYTETGSNIGLVNGVGVIDTAPPPPTVNCPTEGTTTTFNIATQALADANTAYNNMTPAVLPGGTDPGAGQLGGLTLAPGVYKSASGSFLITGSDLTLNGNGDTNAVWVFQMASSLTVGAAGAPRNVILTNGAQAKNVFWQVGSSATINAAGGGTMVGTIISSAGTSISTAGNAAIVT